MSTSRKMLLALIVFLGALSFLLFLLLLDLFPAKIYLALLPVKIYGGVVAAVLACDGILLRRYFSAMLWVLTLVIVVLLFFA